jgi:hypothetical protein
MVARPGGTGIRARPQLRCGELPKSAGRGAASAAHLGWRARTKSAQTAAFHDLRALTRAGGNHRLRLAPSTERE